MISPEQLRKYPFFARLSEAQLGEIAMISDMVDFPEGSTILREGDEIEGLYFLIDGSIDLFYHGKENDQQSVQAIPVGSINPGEPFSISALVEPHISMATVKAFRDSRTIRIDAESLNELFEIDHSLAALMKRKVAEAIIERLHATRNQLAAALT
jgi:CRP-like cAMP-binding protein